MCSLQLSWHHFQHPAGGGWVVFFVGALERRGVVNDDVGICFGEHAELRLLLALNLISSEGHGMLAGVGWA